MKKSVKIYVVSIAATLAVGGLSALLTQNSMQNFQTLNQPPLSPPGWLFPVVWTVLYTLMGISLSKVLLSSAPLQIKQSSLTLYIIQLFFNFFWSILFFNFNAYLLSFIWLIVLLGLIIAMTLSFAKADKPAAFLQIPYILWVSFAAYLNLGIYFLNR
jgi:tryptophan-rich sensory protein